MLFSEAYKTMKINDRFTSNRLDMGTVIIKKENNSYKWLYTEIDEENECCLCNDVLNLEGEIIPAELEVLSAVEIAHFIESSENTFDYGVECAEKGKEQGRLERDKELRPVIEFLKNIEFPVPHWVELKIQELLKNIPPLIKDE